MTLLRHEKAFQTPNVPACNSIFYFGTSPSKQQGGRDIVIGALGSVDRVITLGGGVGGGRKPQTGIIYIYIIYIYIYIPLFWILGWTSSKACLLPINHNKGQEAVPGVTCIKRQKKRPTSSPPGPARERSAISPSMVGSPTKERSAI